MRRRRWFLWLAPVVVAFAASLVAALRPRPNELEFLKPLSTGEVTIYEQFTTPFPPTFVADHRMNFNGKDTQRVHDLLRIHFSPANGWKEDVGEDGFTHFDTAGRETGDWLEVFDDSDGITTISRNHKLTAFEVWMVRLRYLGKNAFEKF